MNDHDKIQELLRIKGQARIVFDPRRPRSSSWTSSAGSPSRSIPLRRSSKSWCREQPTAISIGSHRRFYPTSNACSRRFAHWADRSF